MLYSFKTNICSMKITSETIKIHIKQILNDKITGIKMILNLKKKSEFQSSKITLEVFTRKVCIFKNYLID